MRFKSVRSSFECSFEEGLFSGYAPDGGMLLPKKIPQLDENDLKQMGNMAYKEIVFKLSSLFIDPEEIDTNSLKNICNHCFDKFDIEETVNIESVQFKNDTNENVFYISELYHGPTFSFKDLGMQFIGALFSHFQSKSGARERITVLCATSGDTGSAAIHCIQNRPNHEIFVLFPRGKISDLQESQMTTAAAAAENVTVISVDGTSDDADIPLKDLMNESAVSRKYGLCTINSVNIARIIVQMAHYFYTYFQVMKKQDKEIGTEIVFAIPCGGFGNATSCLLAKKMGLPIENILISTNKNDTLDRVLKEGVYKPNDVVFKTSSPAMDIQVPYNIERFLYLLQSSIVDEKDATEKIAHIMETFETKGSVEIPSDIMDELKKLCRSNCVNEEIVAETAKNIVQKGKNGAKYHICPHTAVACASVKKFFFDNNNKNNKNNNTNNNCIAVLATAHAGKFAMDEEVEIPKELLRLKDLPKESIPMDGDKNTWKDQLHQIIRNKLD